MSNLVLRLVVLRPLVELLAGRLQCSCSCMVPRTARRVKMLVAALGTHQSPLLLQAQAHGSSTSVSGSTYGADSEEEFNAQLAEEGSAPDADAQLTASLLGALHQPDMAIGVAPTPIHRTWS